MIVMTERERLIELLGGKNGFTEQDNDVLADYLLANGVHITACATCEYIKHLKDKGVTIELMGKPLTYCPECGEELEWQE